MAANYPIEQTVPGYDYAPSADNQTGSRQYDSFIVRLWQDDESESMVRVELQHVQAGLSIKALKVPLEWIVPEIMGCLKAGTSELANSEAPR